MDRTVCSEEADKKGWQVTVGDNSGPKKGDIEIYVKFDITDERRQFISE